MQINSCRLFPVLFVVMVVLANVAGTQRTTLTKPSKLGEKPKAGQPASRPDSGKRKLNRPDPPLYMQTTGKINGYNYADLGLSVKWATCNVGAATPSDYGNYYAWGETATKIEYSKDNCVTWEKNIGDISGNLRYDAAKANWGSPWRMPTQSELEELREKCTWTWAQLGSHTGYAVTGPNGNTIFLPANGWSDDSAINYPGYYGGYWSSIPLGSDTQCARSINFFGDGGGWLSDFSLRSNGLSVRPVSD